MLASRPAPDFRLNPQVATALARIGAEQEPLLQVDGLVANPAALIEWAAGSDFAPAWRPEGGYPGLRAPAPLDYVGAVVRSLAPMIEQAFATGPLRLVRAECNLSLVTLAPDRLADAQRAPHVDCNDAWQFAILHYLCDPAQGGTGFFRHRTTGFERITPEREAAYHEVRRQEIAGDGVPPGYVTNDDRHFTRIAAAEPAFNRIIVYRSHLLHSGLIGQPERLSAHPATGRLTANIFLRVAPK